jgi:pilus assembly protein CpaC
VPIVRFCPIYEPKAVLMRYVPFVCVVLALATTAQGQQPDPRTQVLVQLRFVKVSRTKLQHMGLDLAKLTGASDAKGGTDPAIGSDRRSSVIDDGSEAQQLMDALLKDNLARVIAEPKLVLPDGKTVNYSSGAKLAIPKPQKDGSTAIGYVYGTEMEVTPAVVGDKVHLAIHAQVSERDDAHLVTVGKETVPGVQSRAFTAHTELKSGQTLVISGPPEVHMEAENRGVPYLSEIPYAGAMFHHVEQTRNEIVTVAFVRAEIVQPPVDGEQTARKSGRDGPN